MGESLTRIFKPLIEQYKKLNKRTKIISLVIIFVIIVLAIVISMLLNRKEYENMFPGINEQESSEIVSMLRDRGERNYYVERDGSIMVLKSEINRIRADLFGDGLNLKNGFSYDTLLGAGFTATDKDREEYLRQDLEQRMAATIGMFDGVKQAVVQITPSKKSPFVLDSEKSTPAKVAITLEMWNNEAPPQKMIRAIRGLASRSVEGLDEANVIIADTTGNSWTPDDENVRYSTVELKSSLEKALDDSIKFKVWDALLPIFGEDSLVVNVKSDIDIDKSMREIMTYVPSPDGDNSGVKNHEKNSEEVVRDGETVGGVPGTETNAEVPIYPGITADNNNLYASRQSEIDYLVSYQKEQIESDSNRIADLSVAVTVDGVRPDDITYQGYVNLIAMASGIAIENAPEKIALTYGPFRRAPVEPDSVPPGGQRTLPSWFWLVVAATAGVIFLLTMLILFLMIKRRKKEEPEAEEETVAEPSLFDIDLLNENLVEASKSREAELKEKITEFVDTNPEVSAQLIRTWLRGGGD